MRNMTHGESAGPAQAQVSLWTPTLAELHDLHRAQFHRTGIIAALINPEGKILMLEHEETQKTKAGMWAPLGETAKVVANPQSDAHIEPSIVTVLRGIREEIGLELQASELRTSAQPGFQTIWPVGMFEGKPHDGHTHAYTPVLHVSESVANRLVQEMQPNEEVAAAQWVSFEQVATRALCRPGLQYWARTVLQRIAQPDYRITHTVAAAQWRVGNAPTQDAILEHIFSGTQADAA